MDVELQTKVHNDLSNLFTLITDMMSDSKVIDEIISQKIKLEETDKEQLKKIITVLTEYDIKVLKNITNGLKAIFEDGVVDVNDIPIMVQIITDTMNNEKGTFKKFVTDVTQIGQLVKIIILMLIRLDLFGITIITEEKIMKIIDSSIALLHTTIIVSKTTGKFCCFDI